MERLLTLLGAEHVQQKAQEILQLEQHLANVRGMCAMSFGAPLSSPWTSQSQIFGDRCPYLLLSNPIPIPPWGLPIPAFGDFIPGTWGSQPLEDPMAELQRPSPISREPPVPALRKTTPAQHILLVRPLRILVDSIPRPWGPQSAPWGDVCAHSSDNPIPWGPFDQPSGSHWQQKVPGAESRKDVGQYPHQRCPVAPELCSIPMYYPRVTLKVGGGMVTAVPILCRSRCPSMTTCGGMLAACTTK